jgi:hypothetical protein
MVVQCLALFLKLFGKKTNPADSNNLINMSMRCMLIEDDNRLLLIDTVQSIFFSRLEGKK